MKAALLLMDGNKVFHPDCVGNAERFIVQPCSWWSTET